MTYSNVLRFDFLRIGEQFTNSAILRSLPKLILLRLLRIVIGIIAKQKRIMFEFLQIVLNVFSLT